ncbi:MAG: hypothetical protein A2X35_03355 [Elusimicrobia bacterium GWA2_61_42]|nr:MAG: hypothetical protein A2X35_03355 [Elusimicrobia bacterium GWA2_61_42]OGR77622.1 MAG: hypothetical protein A2X38_09595 [Elusimicrobia bacterium GWC2_61_25]
MTNKLVVALACLGFTATAGAEVNFDQDLDIKSVIEQAKNSDVKAPYPYYGPHRVRYSRECKNFSFGPSAFAQASERAYLSSTEYTEDCRFVPNPPPPPPPPPQPNPNGPKPPNPPGQQPGHPNPPGHQPGHPKDYNPGFPGYNGSDDGPHGNYSYPGNYGNQQGTWYCHERAGRVFQATAQLNVAPRQLYPWESEAFNVCMEADRVELDTRHSPYRYHVDRQGMYDVTFNLTPNYRTPTAPDSNGLSASSFAFRDDKFVLDVSDRWGGEYAGEKVEIKVELFKDGFLFFNSSQGEKTFTFDVARGYQLAFAEGDLQKTAAFADPGGDLRGPKKFYVKWGFRRVGSISINEYVNKGSTDKITK